MRTELKRIDFETLGPNGNFSEEDLASLVARRQVLSLIGGSVVDEETTTLTTMDVEPSLGDRELCHWVRYFNL